MSLENDENVVIVKQLGYGWSAKLLSVSSGSKLFAYGTIVVLSRLRVNFSN